MKKRTRVGGALTFNRTDWQAEGERIATAFGIEHCELKLDRYMWRDGSRISDEYELPDGNDLWVRYTPKQRYFSVTEDEDTYAEKAFVILSWDGSLLDCGIGLREGCRTLAQGLFKLGLLTPEIEARLEVTISATEKIEWTREFDIQTGAGREP